MSKTIQIFLDKDCTVIGPGIELTGHIFNISRDIEYDTSWHRMYPTKDTLTIEMNVEGSTILIITPNLGSFDFIQRPNE